MAERDKKHTPPVKGRHKTDEEYAKASWSVGVCHRLPTRTRRGTGMFAHLGPLGDGPVDIDDLLRKANEGPASGGGEVDEE